MTIYYKGLLRAMKAAYKDSGYVVAVTDDSVIIQTTFWGVEIVKSAVPNSIKGLIVVHNGEMPRQDTAVNIQKSECSSVILETALATMDELAKKFTANGGIPIKPTRLTFDGMRVWQTTTDLNLRLVECDLEKGECVIVRRTDREKIVVKLENLEEAVAEQLKVVQQQMYDKAKKNLDEHIFEAHSIEEAKKLQDENGGYIKTMWCGDLECELAMKEKAGMSSRCIPFAQEKLGETCACCGKPADKMIYWGVAY